MLKWLVSAPMTMPAEASTDNTTDTTGAAAPPSRSTWDVFGTIDRVMRRSFDALPAVSVSDTQVDALAVLNGAVGDLLDEQDSPLGIQMSITPGIAGAPPDEVNGHVVVFVHGLMQTEECWGDDAVSYGNGLVNSLGVKSLYVRYNTGRHISMNGRDLADALESLIDDHPGRLDEMTIVSHSMGGLVVRSACHYGEVAGHRWMKRTLRMAFLGSPLSGSILEQIGAIASFALRAVPNAVTRIITNVTDRRSAGIQDLRLGAIVDEDWDRNSGELPEVSTSVTLPPHIHVFVATADTGDDISALLAEVLGDQADDTGGDDSSHAAPGSTSIPRVVVHAFARVGHLGLTRHRDVYERLVAWLSEPIDADETAFGPSA